MSTHEKTSRSQQRHLSKIEEKPMIDPTVWRTKDHVAEERDELIDKQKEIQAELSAINARRKAAQSRFHMRGIRDPLYSQMVEEKSKLATDYQTVSRQLMQMRRQDRKEKAKRREASIKAQNMAAETQGDVFQRIAKLMLADDVYRKINETAYREWRRLYDPINK